MGSLNLISNRCKKQQGTCPQGYIAVNPVPVNHSLNFRFLLKTCATCELCHRYCTGKSGRTIEISAYYELTEAARTHQKTGAFKKDYHQHRSVSKAHYLHWFVEMECASHGISDKKT